MFIVNTMFFKDLLIDWHVYFSFPEKIFIETAILKVHTTADYFPDEEIYLENQRNKNVNFFVHTTMIQ